MSEPPSADDLEWHEQIARRLEAIRHRRVHLHDLVGAVVVSAFVLWVVRSLDGPGLIDQMFVIAGLAIFVVLAVLGVFAAVGLGRLATLIRRSGSERRDLIGFLGVMTAGIVEMAGFGLLMLIGFSVSLFLAFLALLPFLRYS